MLLRKYRLQSTTTLQVKGFSAETRMREIALDVFAHGRPP